MGVKAWLHTANMPLQMKIGLSVLAGLVVGLGLFSWVGLQAVNTSTNRILDERLNRARIAAELLDQNLSHLVNHLQTAANTLTDVTSASQFKNLADSLPPILADVDVQPLSIALVDPDGNVLQVSRTDGSNGGGILEWKAVMAGIIRAGGPAVSNAMLDEAGRQVVLATSPIPGPDGRPSGFIGVSIDIGDYASSYFGQAMRIGDTGYAEVVDGNGVILMRTQPASRPLGSERSDHPGRFAQLISEGKAAVGTCHRCHEEEQNITRRRDLLAFAPLSTTSWGVALRQSEEEALAPTRQLEQRLLILGAIVLAGVALMVWGIMRSVVRPVQALTAATQRVAMGDFKAAVPARRRDEIGRLSTAFHAMTAELERSREQLLSRNRELSVLNSVATSVSQSLDRDFIVGNALERVLEAERASYGCVLLVDPDTGNLTVKAKVGCPDFFSCGATSSAACACYQVMRSGQIMAVNHPDQCPLLNGSSTEEYPAGFLVVPLKSRVRVLGVMSIRFGEKPITDNDLKLLESIGYYVGLAIENAALYEESKRKEELRGKLLSQVINAQEEERKRISRELHDEHGQILTGIIMNVDKMETMIAPEQAQLRAKVEKARALLSKLLDNIRLMTVGLRPSDLDDLGLVAAIQAYAEERLGAAGIAFKFGAHELDRSLPKAIETALFRIVQEAINNVIRHAEATRVLVHLGLLDGKIRATITDNGQGFEPNLNTRDKAGSLGLLGVRERAELLGGTLTIRSRPGRGTRLIVEIPVPDFVAADGAAGA